MIYIVDGANFSNLEEFWKEIERIFSFTVSNIEGFKRSFSSLRDLLAILPKDTIVVWKNSKLSVKRLGFAETINMLQETQKNCHPSWNEIITKEIELAQYNLGETIFDVVVKIFVEESITLRLE
jgi:RNAse (barnase) inhibitor barstar